MINQLSKGQKIYYSGLGDEIKGKIKSINDKKLVIDFGYSLLTMTLNKKSTLKSLGLSLNSSIAKS